MNVVKALTAAIALALVPMDSVIADSVTTGATGGAGVGIYATGYQLGMISKFSVSGMMNKTGEGQLLLGRESTPYIITTKCGDDTCQETVNPWYFSMNTMDARFIEPYVGGYAWVQYNQAQVKSPMYDTPILITQIGDVDKLLKLTSCIDSNASGARSEGVRVGRIVTATQSGHLSKTGEILLQQGNAGNQFKNMSVSAELFDCAVRALKSAMRVKVHYAQSWIRNPLSSDTTYAVTQIEIIEDI